MKKLMLKGGNFYYKNPKNSLRNRDLDLSKWFYNQANYYHLNPSDDCCETFVPPSTDCSACEFEVIQFSSSISFDQRLNKIYVYNGELATVSITLPTTLENSDIPIGARYQLINLTTHTLNIVSTGVVKSISTLNTSILSQQNAEYTITKISDTEWIVSQ